MRFFDPEQMLLIEKAQDIEKDFFDRKIKIRPYEGGFSPCGWLNELDARFS